jgi:hypothetical protein
LTQKISSSLSLCYSVFENIPRPATTLEVK